MFGEFTVSASMHDAVWYDMIDRGYVEVATEFVDKEIEIQEDIPQ